MPHNDPLVIWRGLQKCPGPLRPGAVLLNPAILMSLMLGLSPFNLPADLAHPQFWAILYRLFFT